MRYYEKYISKIPILLFIIVIGSVYVANETPYWAFINKYVAQVFTMIMLSYMLFYAKWHKHCLYLKTIILGLMCVNVLNIFRFALDIENYYIYTYIIGFITAVLALIFAIKKTK